ncbi:MAG: PIG-L deacetylase family protein [Pseudonocardiaceae bacterium]
MTTGDRVLVVAAHPDDETLGAGGTIVRLAASGIEVHVLAVGCCRHPSSDPVRRVREFDEACAVLGARSTQLQPAPHPRSLEAIQAMDINSGAAIGAAAAETFVPYRVAF